MHPDGTFTIDLLRAVGIIKDENVRDNEKLEVIANSVRVVVNGYLQNNLTQKHFRKMIGMLHGLDDSDEKERIKIALQALEDDFPFAVSELSNDFMIRLDFMDIEVCDARRMAAYIRHMAYELLQIEGYIEQAQSALRRSQLENKKDDYIGRFNEILAELFVRCEDQSDLLQVRDIAHFLTADTSGELPHYILHALELMAQEENENVEVLLEPFKRLQMRATTLNY